MTSRRAALRCIVFAAAELGLYLSYRSHDARFHWATHFLVGATAATLGMALYAALRDKPPPDPELWLLGAHLFAMFPDFLFEAGIPHEWWMEVFLLHIRSHFVPGRNVFWLLTFLAVLGGYLVVLDRLRLRREGAAAGQSASPASQ